MCGFLTLTQSTVAELFPENKPVLRYLFARNADGNLVILSAEGRVSEYEASITFPKSLSEQLTSDEAGLVLSYYDSGNLFPLEGNSTDLYTYITPVVAASFTNQDIDNLKDDVIITLKLDITSRANVSCVSWDFQANGKNNSQTNNRQTNNKLTNRQSINFIFVFPDGLGSWVEDGCELVSLEDGEATCACSHLTNFACLVEDEPPTSSTDNIQPVRVPNTLSVITIIGVCISILSLILTIITLLVFG